MTVRLLIGDVHERLAEIPDHSIDFLCCSPPFPALRDYLPRWHPDKHREIGHEPSPADYLDVLLILTAEFRRVLIPYGSIAIELGDKYADSGGAGGDYDPDGWRAGQNRYGHAGGNGWPLSQSLCGIPDAYALSLEYGWNVLRRNAEDSPAGKWRVRNKKSWVRSNPPVGALGRKERPATSYITVASTVTRRWFDLDAVRTAPAPNNRRTTKDVDQIPRVGKSADRGGNWASLPEQAESGGAPPLDWYNPIDAAIDRELQARAGKPVRHGGGTNNMHSHAAGEDRIDRALPAAPAESVGARGWHIRRALQNAGHLPPTADTYDISPRGYAGSHYAVWPRELCRQLIDEMAPRRVCVICGKPSERIVDTSYEALEDPAKNNAEHKAVGVRRTGDPHSENAQGMRYGRATKNTTTLGWSDCGHNTWRPGMICDPFAGSGTTLAVAQDMGRDAVGIDIDQATYGMTAGRLGPLLAALVLEVVWPEPNWDAPALPRGGGDYGEWNHITGVVTRTKWTEGGNHALGSYGGNPPPAVRNHNPGRIPPRGVVEVRGQAGLFDTPIMEEP